MKVSLMGAGRVGTATAFSLLHSVDLDELMLIDVQKELALGEALDLQHAAIGLLADCVVSGSSDIKDAQGSEAIVIAAGSARKPGQTREDLFAKNKLVVESIISGLPLSGNEKLVIVTNPVDQLTFAAFKKSGLPRKQVIGVGCLLDTFRLTTLIGNLESDSFVFGQHGDEASFALRGTDNVESEQVRDMGMDIIKLKGYSSWGPGAAVARTVEAILEDTHEIMPVSCVLDGEFGLKHVALSVPASIGSQGVLSIEEDSLTIHEKERLASVAEIIYGRKASPFPTGNAQTGDANSPAPSL